MSLPVCDHKPYSFSSPMLHKANSIFVTHTNMDTLPLSEPRQIHKRQESVRRASQITYKGRMAEERQSIPGERHKDIQYGRLCTQWPGPRLAGFPSDRKWPVS